MDLIITAVGSSLITGVIVWAAIDWRLTVADDHERRARAIRDEAARIEAAAAWHETCARAIYEDTAAHQTITPPMSVRLLAGRVWTEAREWARGVGPDRSAPWGEGELTAITRRWLTPDHATPTPLLMERLPYDPTRIYRVNVRRPWMT